MWQFEDLKMKCLHCLHFQIFKLFNFQIKDISN